MRSLFLFGSVARDEARQDNDIDLLVEFDRPIGLLAFSSLRLYLQEILGKRVDLATADALRDQMRAEVLREAVRAS